MKKDKIGKGLLRNEGKRVRSSALCFQVHLMFTSNTEQNHKIYFNCLCVYIKKTSCYKGLVVTVDSFSQRGQHNIYFYKCYKDMLIISCLFFYVYLVVITRFIWNFVYWFSVCIFSNQRRIGTSYYILIEEGCYSITIYFVSRINNLNLNFFLLIDR